MSNVVKELFNLYGAPLIKCSCDSVKKLALDSTIDN